MKIVQLRDSANLIVLIFLGHAILRNSCSIMKRIKRGSFKATFIDRRGSRRQDISLSLNQAKNEEAINSLSAGASMEPSCSASLTVNECTVAVPDLDGPDDFQRHSVTAHENRRIQEQLKWEELRDRLVSVTFEDSFLPKTACVWCQTSAAAVRCRYCGPKTLLCLECAKKLHVNINNYHVLELWKVQLLNLTPVVC